LTQLNSTAADLRKATGHHFGKDTSSFYDSRQLTARPLGKDPPKETHQDHPSAERRNGTTTNTTPSLRLHERDYRGPNSPPEDNKSTNPSPHSYSRYARGRGWTNDPDILQTKTLVHRLKSSHHPSYGRVQQTLAIDRERMLEETQAALGDIHRDPTRRHTQRLHKQTNNKRYIYIYI